MKKLQLLFVFLLLSVVGFGQLTVTVPTITATPGQTVNIPVKIYGAGSSGTPISSANIKIPFDTTLIRYLGIVNFYTGTPSGEWYYSGNFDADCNSYTVAANWLQSSLGTVAVPDGTTLYEIQFYVKGGNSPLNFCVYEFTNAAFDLVPTTPTNGAINMVPASLTGPTAVCLGSAGNLYTTDAGKTGYLWTVNGGTITAGGTMTDNTATVTWNTAGTENITVTYSGANPSTLPVNVTPGPLASVSIAASSNPVCLNTAVTFTATPTNGGTTPSYQWKKNGTNVGANTATYTYNPANNDVITCVMTSSETCISGNPATSNNITMTVNPLTSSISISASANPVVSGTSVTFTATTTNGGPSPAFQWRVNGANVGTSTPTFTYTPVNGDNVFCLLTPNAPCVNATFTSNLITMTVTSSPLLVTVSTKTAIPGQTVYFPVKLKGASASGTPISSANIQIAYDAAALHYDTIVNFYATMPSGQWFFSGNNSTVAANWIEPNLLTLAIPDSTTLFEIKFTYLGGTSALPFTVYEFTDAQFNFITTNHVDGGISTITPSLSGPTNVCEGSAGHVYTTDGGKSNYNWSLTGGTITAGGSTADNTATVTWNTAGAQSISVAYDGSVTTAMPVTVNPLLPVSVSIAASANPACLNTSVTFTATPTNGGTTPSYQWKKNGANVGTNSATYTYNPANNDVITCVMTSNGTCISGNPAISNAITMTVYPLTSSISISASANPVLAGTTVTFSATTVNGGPSPAFQWRVNGANVGTSSPIYTYTPANGDVVFCLLTPNAPCVNATFTSNVITMTVNNPAGSLLITLPNQTAMPGDLVYFPVKLKGASASGVPISSANIQITYDPAVLHYDTLVNFYAAMPSNQWFFSGNLNTVAANWMEPSLLTLAVPDSTTLFEIKFTYLGGTGSLPFTVNEFTNATFDFIPTSHFNGGVTQLVPTNNTIQNVNIANGDNNCYNAIQVLTVAGSGSTVIVNNGGSANFIAGQKVDFLPGFSVLSGGYAHGFITTNGQYCMQQSTSMVNTAKEGEATPVPELGYNDKSIRVFPNPTTGKFTVELKGDASSVITKVEVYGMTGTIVYTDSPENSRSKVIDATGFTPGLYFIHVLSGDQIENVKLIKL